MQILIICIIPLFGHLHACPRDEIITPCECSNVLNSDVMTCAYLLEPDELVKPITAVAERRSPIKILGIGNSPLLYIPNPIFKGTSFEKIYFIHSEVRFLSVTDIAFEGLENSLTEFRATTTASYIAEWDWKQLRNLKKLQLIDVEGVDLGNITTRFPDLKNLKFLALTYANIIFIIQYAFADLIGLTVLSLRGNEISGPNRNIFPEPAYNLISIDLSTNELSHLPEDIFRNMPVLESVILEYNNFKTLDRKEFSWALDHLSELAMFPNRFVCDCKLKWMIGGNLPVRFTAECESPRSLKGKSLRSLQLEELHC